MPAMLTAALLVLSLAGKPLAPATVPPERVQAAKRWLATIRQGDPQRVLVRSAVPASDEPDTLLVTVGEGWHTLEKGRRLDLAHSFWLAWIGENHDATLENKRRFRVQLHSAVGRFLGEVSWGGSGISAELLD